MRRKLCTICLSVILLFSLLGTAGCSGNPFQFTDEYDTYYESRQEEEVQELTGMADGLAVLDADSQDSAGYESDDTADLLINDTTGEVITSRQCFARVYPASVTKIMTALLVLEEGNLNDTVTLEQDVTLSEEGAVVSTLSKGDTLTVDALFHGLLIKSANDCAVILAEYIAGSEEAFVDRMNQRALELGATHTHFVNSNGLHDKDHYTTAYDLYLIFREVVQYDAFVEAIGLKDYTMNYTTADGTRTGEYMQTTNEYLLKEYPIPEGVTMYGGKTGTTSAAGSCLILMTENEEGERFFSVVMGAETKEDLYDSMSRLLEQTGNP